MKLKDSFITHDSDGEQIMVDTSGQFSGMVRSNKTAAYIVELLKEEHTLDELVDALYAKYDAPKDVLKKDAEAIVKKLKQAGCLE